MKKSNKILKNFIWFTVVPFLIPFILQIDDELVAPAFKWLVVAIVTIIDFVFSFKALKENERDKRDAYIQNSIRHAYSGAYEIIDNKRDGLSHETERIFKTSTGPFPYDVEQYIGDICKEFKKVIASITDISSEYLSSTFIYRYNAPDSSKEDKKWRYLSGKEPTTKYNINEFVAKEGTTYYAIVEGKKRYVFGNNKKAMASDGLYYLSERDKVYNNVGSIFSILVAFGNNETNLVEGIITVSTHGKYFTENSDISDAENTLRDMIITEIFPYYRRLLENELGIMYIKHRYETENEPTTE